MLESLVGQASPRGGVFYGWYPEEFAEDAAERCEQCLAKAQAALADGDGVRARFWAERAQHYRERMQRS